MRRARSSRRVLRLGSGANWREAMLRPGFGLTPTPHRTDRFRHASKNAFRWPLEFNRLWLLSRASNIGANSPGTITIRSTLKPVVWRVSLYRALLLRAPLL